MATDGKTRKNSVRRTTELWPSCFFCTHLALDKELWDVQVVCKRGKRVGGTYFYEHDATKEDIATALVGWLIYICDSFEGFDSDETLVNLARSLKDWLRSDTKEILFDPFEHPIMRRLDERK